MATATIMASKTLPFQNPNLQHRPSLNPTTLYLRLPQHPPSLKLPPFKLRPSPKPLRISATSSPQSPVLKPGPDAVQTTIADSTRTISAILALAVSASAAILTTIRNLGVKIRGLCVAPTPEEMAGLQSLQESLVCTVGPMFFAAIRSRPSGALNTPLTVVAAGLSKWLDIYSGVLLVRVLLSWFPFFRIHRTSITRPLPPIGSFKEVSFEVDTKKKKKRRELFYDTMHRLSLVE
uniref:Uncharacterized protein n=1 Tax=Kalanchoe fedtschenkoi TaxID=63787 RepID=A0A7N0UI51_KALFE